MPAASLLLQDKKRTLREHMRLRRQAAAQNVNSAPQRICEIFRQFITIPAPTVIATYHAFCDEIDASLLINDLRDAGCTIVLPVMAGKDKPLTFRRFEPSSALHANAMGILEPGLEQPYAKPNVLLVPLLAFDNQKNRLGYGGGFYDRTLSALRQSKAVLAIGIAYSCQQVDAVPVEPHDIPLDRIVTEINVF